MEMPYSDTNTGLHYDIRLEIRPRTQHLTVSGSLAYHSPMNGLERARFYLHRQFQIQRIEGRRVAGYHFESGSAPDLPGAPEAGVLDIYFQPPLRKNETTLIQFDYLGTISLWPAESPTLITEEWVEIGRALPWFPVQFHGRPSELTFTLQVFAPAGYQVASHGPAEFVDNHWEFRWLHPTDDIVVAAGSALDVRPFDSETNHITVATASFSNAAASLLGEDLLWTIDRFSGWFGPIRPAEFTLIESPRPLGGGYDRRGLVVLGSLNERDYLSQREAYLRYLAHEAAHRWWWEASTDSWEDWLNESFAEYSALLAVRERYGTETFERFLDRKRERAGAPLALWGFDRADMDTLEKQEAVKRMLYDHGPLVLHGLAQRIGGNRFLELCRARLWSGVTTTEHLLDLLEELEDLETRHWFEDQLRQTV